MNVSAEDSYCPTIDREEAERCCLIIVIFFVDQLYVLSHFSRVVSAMNLQPSIEDWFESQIGRLMGIINQLHQFIDVKECSNTAMRHLHLQQLRVQSGLVKSVANIERAINIPHICVNLATLLVCELNNKIYRTQGSLTALQLQHSSQFLDN